MFLTRLVEAGNCINAGWVLVQGPKRKSHLSGLRLFLLAAPVFLLSLTWIGHPTKAARLAAEIVITRVIDGDTVVARISRPGGPPRTVTIRLMGFDTPETYYARCVAEYWLGIQAKRRLIKLLASGRLRLEPHGRDKYRRLLARIYVDGVDVARVMIREGYARPYHGGRRKGWCGPIERKEKKSLGHLSMA